jgi:hypothetical protein
MQYFVLLLDCIFALLPGVNCSYKKIIILSRAYDNLMHWSRADLAAFCGHPLSSIATCPLKAAVHIDDHSRCFS